MHAASRVRSFKLLALVALFAGGLVQAWQFRPYDRAVLFDDQLYFYVAERAAAGVAPHVSLVDHKHQLSGLLSGAAMVVGRIVGADDVMAARTLSVVLAAAIVPLLCVLAEALTGSFAAGCVAGACALTFKKFFIEAATGFRPQLFMTFFVVAALAAFARSRPALAGALAAGAFLCWQPALVVGAALVVASLFCPRPAASAARVLIGGLAAVLCYEAYFFWKGALGEQIYQSYLMGRNFDVPWPADTVRFIVRGDPSESRWRPDAVFSAVLLAGAPLLWLWALLRPRRAWAAWRANAGRRAILVAGHGAVGFTFLDHQAFPDRFFILPYVALAGAALVALVPRRVFDLPARPAVSAAVCVWIISSVPYVVARARAEGALDRQRAAAKSVVEFAKTRGGGLWVVGRPDVLAFEHEQNWNSFGMLLDEHVREYARRTARSRGAYRPVRGGKMPEVIVTARLPLRRNLPWLLKEYEKIELGELADLRASVFVKKRKPVRRSPP